jgi:hypothetical protein
VRMDTISEVSDKSGRLFSVCSTSLAISFFNLLLESTRLGRRAFRTECDELELCQSLRLPRISAYAVYSTRKQGECAVQAKCSAHSKKLTRINIQRPSNPSGRFVTFERMTQYG